MSHIEVLRNMLNNIYSIDPDGSFADALEFAIELIAASDRTIQAFESLGKAEGVIANLEARRECEAALIAQKVARDKVKL